MKICIVGDIHFSSTSSILREKGERFTKRLENCIDSIEYVEKYADKNGCEYIIYLGDFFDKETLNSEELTALQSICWSDVRKIFLVGNHEMGAADLSRSSAHLFNLVPRATVIDSPNGIVGYGVRLMFLPYILEPDRKTVSEYFEELFCRASYFETQEVKKTYIFSHNDIKGIQMGKFVSEEGFDINDIESNCLLCFNGHLHNESRVGSKIINVGNLTGQNFSEDVKYRHKFDILDTDTGEVKEVINPFAYYFQRVEIMNEKDFNEFREWLKSCYSVILSIKCVNRLSVEVRKLIEDSQYVVTYRIINVMEDEAEVEDNIQELTDTDYVEQFCNFVLTAIGTNDIVKQELMRISK